MITKKDAPQPDKLLVTFTLPAAIWAETVCLVGDFNAWNPASHPFMHDKDDGTWEVTILLDKGRSYQFRYLVNGNQWQNDRQADGSFPNFLGGENSVIIT